MSDTYYTAEYCGLIYADRGPQQGGIPLNFEHFARTFMNGLMCVDRTGSKTGVTHAPELVERHGSFGYFKMTFNRNGHSTTWANALPQGESTSASTLAACKQKTLALRTKVRNVIDNAGVPAAPTERERAVNFLLSMDLTGHHPGFVAVRNSYVDVLNDLTGNVSNHWMYRAPLHAPVVGSDGWPLDAVIVQDMLTEIGAHPATAPCRIMQYAMMYGGLAVLLDTPVT